MKKTKKKKLIPRLIRNKYVKEKRTLLKNKKILINAKTIYLG